MNDKTVRETTKNLPKMDSPGVGRAVGSVAADRAGQLAKGVADSAVQRVIAPVIQTALMSQVPLLNTAFSTISGVFGDLKMALEKDESLKREKQNADRIGMIADNTGETTEEIDELGEILSQIGESIYEGVYNGVQDGLSALVGDFFDGVGSGIKEAFQEAGRDPEEMLNRFGEKFDRWLDRDKDADDDEYLEALWSINDTMNSVLLALTTKDDDELRRLREEALEARSDVNLKDNFVKDKDSGQPMMSGPLEKLLHLFALKGALGSIGKMLGGVVKFLMGPVKLAVAGLSAVFAAITSPIGLIVAAVAAVVAGLTYVAHKLGDGDIIEGFKIMFDSVIDWFKRIPEWVNERLADIPGELASLFKNPVDTIMRWGREITESFMQPLRAIREFFSEEIAMVDTFLQENGVYDAVEWLLNSVTDSLKTGFAALTGTSWEETWDGIVADWESFTEKVKTIFEYIVDLPNKLAEWVNSGLEAAGLSGVFGNINTAVMGATGKTTEQLATEALDATSRAIGDMVNWFQKDQAGVLKDAVLSGNKSLTSQVTMLSRQGIQETQSKMLKDELAKLNKNLLERNPMTAVSNFFSTVNNASTMAQQIFPKGMGFKPNRPDYGH